MLRITDLRLAAGPLDLLTGADAHVHPGERVGLVGRNGCGKTSLLRAIRGELLPEGGTIAIRSGARVGFLDQHADTATERTVWEEARAGLGPVLDLEADYQAALKAAESGDAAAIAKLDEATERLRVAGGFALDERVGAVLHGLGLDAPTWQRPCSSFSGGWRVRIGLARLLLSQPELLVLDEPTNHLDVLARGWLQGFLARYPGTLLVVSHDRHLLDGVCTRILEVRGGRLHAFSGGYTAWRAARALRLEQAQAAYESQQAEIARLERFVDRFKAKATKAAQARSRQKQLDKMERLEAPELDRDPSLTLPPAPDCSAEAVVLDGATLAWPDGPDILTGVELRLERGMRLGVLGLNGSGKSTLLSALDGSLDPRAGRLRLGRGVRIGRYSQHLTQALDPEKTGLEVLRELAPAAEDSRLRGVLGALGLSGDAALRPVGQLSGGEKARVVLAGFCARPANVLLLDEPTNHLDVVTVDVLIEALQAFEGAMVVVSHDRHLVEAVATHVAVVRDGAVTIAEGVRPEDFDLTPPTAAAKVEASEGALAHADRKAERRARQKMEKRAEAVQDEIATAEARLGEVDVALVEAGGDADALVRLSKERAEVEARIEALFEEWETLEEALG
jgi:ATP-binding cassette subfamily F protein 3